MPPTNPRRQQKVPAPLLEHAEMERKIANDAALAVDKPEYVTYHVVLAAMAMFQRLVGRKAQVMYVPKILEVSLQINWIRNMGAAAGRKIRELPEYLGCRVVWDADEFRLE